MFPPSHYLPGITTLLHAITMNYISPAWTSFQRKHRVWTFEYGFLCLTLCLGDPSLFYEAVVHSFLCCGVFHSTLDEHFRCSQWGAILRTFLYRSLVPMLPPLFLSIYQGVKLSCHGGCVCSTLVDVHVSEVPGAPYPHQLVILSVFLIFGILMYELPYCFIWFSPTSNDVEHLLFIG